MVSVDEIKEKKKPASKQQTSPHKMTYVTEIPFYGNVCCLWVGCMWNVNTCSILFIYAQHHLKQLYR